MSETPWSPEEYADLAGFGGDWRDSWWNRDFLALMAHRWRLGEAHRLLDVGCGHGHWGQALARFLPSEARVDGVDREAAFADAAAERARSLGLGPACHYAEGTAEALPFDDDTFDVVTCQTVLIHVADPAVALREMVRVTRPGGLVTAVEPDALANTVSMANAEPRPDWATLQAILRFQHVCETGKQALGRGDSSIGGRLPGLLLDAGLDDIASYSSDRTPFWLPPYDAPDQKIDTEQWLSFFDGDTWVAAGTEADARELFAAGGGDASEFEGLWHRVMDLQHALARAVREGRYRGGRGLLVYLVSGRVPGGGNS